MLIRRHELNVRNDCIAVGAATAPAAELEQVVPGVLDRCFPGRSLGYRDRAVDPHAHRDRRATIAFVDAEMETRSPRERVVPSLGPGGRIGDRFRPRLVDLALVHPIAGLPTDKSTD